MNLKAAYVGCDNVAFTKATVASAPVTVTDCGNNIIGVPSHLLFLVMPNIMNGTILVEKVLRHSAARDLICIISPLAKKKK